MLKVITSKKDMCACMLSPSSHVWIFETPLSVGSSGRKTGVGCHSIRQGNLPDPGIKPAPPKLQADSLLLSPRKALSKKDNMI